jgi:hypothetical protein
MPATSETPSPGGNPGARDHTASDEPTTTPGIAFGMGITALLAKRLPVQHRWRCHWLVPQLDATDGQGVALGRGVQPICPHYPASRYRHVQQVAPQEFLQGQGHQAHPQARSRGSGSHPLRRPGHQARVRQQAAPQVPRRKEHSSSVVHRCLLHQANFRSFHIRHRICAEVVCDNRDGDEHAQIVVACSPVDRDQ